MLGNFMPGVNAVSRDDVDLIKLNGSINGTSWHLLLDSGASCNFISAKTVEKLDVVCISQLGQKVQLADGSKLQTCGKVDLQVELGTFTYLGTFFVL